MVNGHRGNIMISDDTEDPLPILRSRTYRGIDDGAQMVYAWEKTGN